MPSSPLISVVIPTHNRLELLRRAIDSAQAQTHKNIEVIVVDDASTISLQPILDSYSNVRILRNNTKSGAQFSRLKGAKAAKGEYIAMLDSDDWWKLEKLELQLKAAKKTPGSFVICRLYGVNGLRRRVAPSRVLQPNERIEDYQFLHDGLIQTSTFFAPKNIMVSLFEHAQGLQVHMDTAIFMEARKRGIKVVHLEQPLVFFDTSYRADRVTLDPRRIVASQVWFDKVSPEWSPLTRQAFMFNDRVDRLVTAGRKTEALAMLFKTFHPSFSKKRFAKRFVFIITNNAPRRIWTMLNSLNFGKKA